MAVDLRVVGGFLAHLIGLFPPPIITVHLAYYIKPSGGLGVKPHYHSLKSPLPGSLLLQGGEVIARFYTQTTQYARLTVVNVIGGKKSQVG